MSSTILNVIRSNSFIERKKSQANLFPNKLVGAIDEGTSSARFILFRCESKDVIASHQEPLKQTYPQEGWVEQDPIEILRVVNKCIEETIAKLKNTEYSAEDIVAIGK